MNYVVRVMKNRQIKDERKKEIETSLCIFYLSFFKFFLARAAKKDWSKTKKKNLNSSMIQLRDELYNHNLDEY
jgi:hypothetical protein